MPSKTKTFWRLAGSNSPSKRFSIPKVSRRQLILKRSSMRLVTVRTLVFQIQETMTLKSLRKCLLCSIKRKKKVKFWALLVDFAGLTKPQKPIRYWGLASVLALLPKFTLTAFASGWRFDANQRLQRTSQLTFGGHLNAKSAKLSTPWWWKQETNDLILSSTTNLKETTWFLKVSRKKRIIKGSSK